MTTNLPSIDSPEVENSAPSELLAVVPAAVADPMELIDDNSNAIAAASDVPAVEPAAESAEPPRAEVTPPVAETSPIDPLPPLRQKLTDRIERSVRLPRGLRQRLLAAMPAAVAGDDQNLLLPVDALVDAVEAWAPTAFQLDGRDLHGAEHPAGDVFFTGDAEQVSDAQAERIARRQLERSGYLPRDAR